MIKNMLIFVMAVAICCSIGYAHGVKSRLNEFINLKQNLEELEQFAPNAAKEKLNPKQLKEIATERQIIRNLLAKEGVYDNDSKDRGGETVYGLSRKFNPSLPIWKEVDKLKRTGSSKKAMVQKICHTPKIKAMAEQVYLAQFRKHGLGEIDLVVADLVFDSFVNIGFGSGSIMVQKLCNSFNYQNRYGSDLPVDANFGKMSRERLKIVVKNHKEQFITALLGLRSSHYVTIATNNTDQRKYISGWINRVATTN